MCPGCTRSFGTEVGLDSAWIVLARSAALIPVVIPLAASTLIWKSVLWLSRLFKTIRSIPSCCKRSGTVGTQISPRPNLAIKLTAFAVAFSPAIMRSPSFSRSASSTTTTILPLAMSLSTDSIELNLVEILFAVIRLNNAGGKCYLCLAKRSRFEGGFYEL